MLALDTHLINPLLVQIDLIRILDLYLYNTFINILQAAAPAGGSLQIQTVFFQRKSDRERQREIYIHTYLRKEGKTAGAQETRPKYQKQTPADGHRDPSRSWVDTVPLEETQAKELYEPSD